MRIKLLPMNAPSRVSQLAPVVKESACQSRRCKRHGFSPWIGKIPWSRKWQPAPVFLPGKFHGQRSLPGLGAAESQTLLSD